MAQRGWITKQDRKKRGPVWVYHWYITKSDSGRKAEHTCVVGAVASLPREKDAWQEIDRRHLQPKPDGSEIPSGQLTFRDLALSYQQNRMRDLAETTQYTNKHMIDDYLVPRWGARLALEIQPLEIEKWLRSLPLANPSKDKVRRVMSIIYTEAQRLRLIPRSEEAHPVRWVQQAVESDYEPVVVEPAQAAKIVDGLSGLERALTLLVAATGLRISEALGLKWEDLDWENQRINLRRVWVGDTVVERLKTKRSRAPVPLSDGLAAYLLIWKAETMYGEPGDWVFASTKSRGRTPRSGSILAADYLRPKAIAAGVKLQAGQRFGFHNLRHSLATFLVNQGTDVKTVQALLRHSNVTTTLGLYAHSVNATMMAASDAMLQAMKPKSDAVN